MDTRTIIAQIMQTLEDDVRKALRSVQLDKEKIQAMLEEAIPEPEVKVEQVVTSSSTEMLETLQRIRSAENQKEVISQLVHELAALGRAASIIILGKHASLWAGPGMGLPDSAPMGSVKMQITVGNDSLIQKAIMERSLVISQNLTATEASIYSSMSIAAPGCIACIPMIINGRVQGILIVDTEENSFEDTAGLSIISGVATVAIEQLPFREKIGFSNFCDIVDVSGEMEGAEVEISPDDTPFEDVVIDEAPEEIQLEEEEEPEESADDDLVADAADSEAEALEEVEEPEATGELEEEWETGEEAEGLEVADMHDEAEAATVPPAEEEPEGEAIELEEAEEEGESLEDYARELESQLGDEYTSEEVEAVEAASSIASPEMEVDEEEEEETGATEDISDIEFMADPMEAVESAPVDEDSGMLEIDTSDMGEGEIQFLDEPEPVLEEKESAPPVEERDEAVPSPDETPSEDLEEEIPVLQESEEEAPAGEASPAEYYDNLSLSGYNLEQYEGEERKMHEKAIRFARLLVSEIKLYNEEDVKKGRENKDLYSRLKDDIQRSQVLYEQRIAAEIRSKTNYFHDEMVRQLADGNPDMLGK